MRDSGCGAGILIADGSAWVESHGDGVCNEQIDTDPLNSDIDGDGILDGEEDSNHNGIWESHLGESSPLFAD